MENKSKKVLFLLLALTCIVFLCIGCTAPDEFSEIQKEQASLTVFPAGQRLRLTVESGNLHGSIQAYHGNYEDRVDYQGIEEILIEVNGTQFPLQDAMEQEIITSDELDCYARIDAKKGLCTMSCASRVGYSRFFYHYDNFDILSTYDVFEAPDGNKYHSQNLVITPAGYYESLKDYIDISRIPVDGEMIDAAREDWGLTFEVVEASSNHLTFRCAQSGGQHMGMLRIVEGFALTQTVGDGRQDHYFNYDGAYLTYEESVIENDSITEFSVPWTENCGELPSSDYQFRFFVKDMYDVNKVPDLMRDYTDQQGYSITFTVP